MAIKPANDQYLFKINAADKHRLDRQYHVFQRYFDKGPITLAGSLTENKVNKVLDVAAGSLAWTLDVARSTDPSTVQLYACDITPDNFPPASVTDPFSITTFAHDVTQPFPEELKGQFDVVNMRLLVYALSEDQWKKVLDNLHDLLRPEGHLFLFETDVCWFTGEETDSGPDMVGSWLSPLNRVFLKHAEATGYVRKLSERLPEMLHNSSFVITEQLTGRFPLGVTSKTCKSIKGACLEGNEEFTAGVAKMIASNMSVEALAGGYLDDWDGNPITTESGRLQLVERFNEDLDVNGVLFQATQITALRI